MERSARLPQSFGRGPLKFGYGEGGRLALFAGALEPRASTSSASADRFRSRQALWEEPIDHNVWGLLEEFGDAGSMAAMIKSPRRFCGRRRQRASTFVVPALAKGLTPGKLDTPTVAEVQAGVPACGTQAWS